MTALRLICQTLDTKAFPIYQDPTKTVTEFHPVGNTI